LVLKIWQSERDMTTRKKRVNIKRIRQPLEGHLEELRRRIIRVLVAIVFTTIFGFAFSDMVFGIISYPAKMVGITLHVVEVTEAFLTKLKVALFFGVLVTIPYMIYEMWMFVVPGLRRNERKYIGIILPVSIFLFWLGGAFCYFVVLPVGLKYLVSAAGETIEPIIKLSSYFSFFLMLTVAFGVAFQMPIVIFILAKLQIISWRFLATYRRHAIVIILSVAAILTPPDVFTQIVLAVPLYILYEISIIVARIFGPKEENEEI